MSESVPLASTESVQPRINCTGFPILLLPGHLYGIGLARLDWFYYRIR